MFRALTILLLGAFLGAALLTPFAFELLGLLFGESPWPFSRVYTRVAMVLALVFMIILKREFGFAELKTRLKGNGLGWKRSFSFLVLGTLLTFLVSLAIFPYVLTQGKIIWAGKEIQYLAIKFLYFIPAALLIGILEESFFRVLLFERFKNGLSVGKAAALVSLVYAVVHFVAPVREFEYTDFSPLAGFTYLSQVLSRMVMPEVFPAMFGLFLVGLTLSFAIQRSGSLYLAVGLHAGWVLAMKVIAAATDSVPGAEFPLGVGRRYYLVSTPVSWVAVLVVLGLLYLILKRKYLPKENK